MENGQAGLQLCLEHLHSSSAFFFTIIKEPKYQDKQIWGVTTILNSIEALPSRFRHVKGAGPAH